MTVLRLCSSLLLLSLLLTACQKNQESPGEVLLRIDERRITLEEFRSDFEKTLPPDQTLSTDERQELEQTFLVQVIDRELALAEARRRGLSVTSEEVEASLAEHRRDYPDSAFEQMLKEREITLPEWRRELENGLLMEKVLHQVVYAGLTVSEEAIRAFYEENREEFDRPDQVRARQIVVGTEEEGREVLALLKGGMDFAEAARQYSLSPDGEEGGDLGFFARGDMPPEFDQVVFTLPVGELSDLVSSDYGYHIFRVEERREAVRLSLKQVRDAIREQLLAREEEIAYQQWLQQLREEATIEVDWTLL